MNANNPNPSRHFMFFVLIAVLAMSAACATPAPMPTPIPPTATLIPPTATPVPPTATPVPPTATRVPPTATPVPPTLKEMAAQVSDKLGIVTKAVDSDPSRVIFLFEEQHDSILGQIEIAVMLNRLYAKHGLRHIGLEGYFPEKGPLKLAWVHRAPYFQAGQKITAREDVIAYHAQGRRDQQRGILGLDLSRCRRGRN